LRPSIERASFRDATSAPTLSVGRQRLKSQEFTVAHIRSYHLGSVEPLYDDVVLILRLLLPIQQSTVNGKLAAFGMAMVRPLCMYQARSGGC